MRLTFRIQRGRELSFSRTPTCWPHSSWRPALRNHKILQGTYAKGVGARGGFVMGVYFQESLVADVQNTIEDALAGRPPKFPQWINGA